VIYCPSCGQVLVPEEDLPVKLPDIKEFAPSINGESPLINVEEFVNCTCPSCGGKAKRETDTMPQWAGSSWYFLRYCDPNNPNSLADINKLKYWMNVDWYNGGMEHVSRHLIYSRFWNLFLYDIGVIPNEEAYKKRTAQGLILGSDGEKMSKSKGNGVNPNDIIDEYGADTLRTYLLFIGDYELPSPWDDNGVKGVRRFLEKVVRLYDKVDKNINDITPKFETLLHQSIKFVSRDIETFKFNTAISQLMILCNSLSDEQSITKGDFEILISLLSVFAPHICEELNELLGNKDLLATSKWLVHDENKSISQIIPIAIQVNGKLRGTVEVKRDSKQEDIEALAFSLTSVGNAIAGKTIVKTIYITNKILSIVVKD
jgi:leucyl-tRNA synthetase